MKLNRKTLKIGSFTLVSTAVVLAVLIFVNLFVAELPRNLTYFDTTPGKVYTLSEDSLTFLEGVNSPINIYMIAESGAESSQSIQITAFIEKYAEANKNITFSTVDPILHPDFTTKYTTETLTQNSVIVESETRNRIIDGGAWYMYETDMGSFDAATYQMYYNYGYFDGTDPFLFYGEMNLTGAIDYVTATDIPKAYVLTGHGEKEITAPFLGYIDKENIEYESFSLMTGDGSIPEDADIIIINVPTTDFREEECNTLVEYFRGGGNIILTTAYNYFSKALTPNLAAALEKMGLTSTDGIIVEGSTSNYYQYPTYIIPKTQNECPYSLEALSGKQMFTPYAHGIEKVKETSSAVYALFSTSDKAYLKTDPSSSETFDKEEGDVDGPFLVGAMASPAGSDSSAGLIWISTPLLLESDYDLGGNSVFFAETLKWMADKETGISILGVDMNSEMLMVTEGSVIGWGAALVIGLPLIILVAGLYVWISRRKR
ncbi:MAG: hypothetical protein E7660_03040 [Ruminococcaceae bacterium]|nr:hypothetical protein [Oscillospiraceae bacterium]